MTDLMKSSWLKKYFVLFVSNLRNLHTTYGQLRFSLTFSFRCFTVLAFIFRSMTHFELIFLYTGVETDFSLYITVQSHQNICWKGYTLPIELPWNFVQKKKKKINWPYRSESISGCSILFHWFICPFLHCTTLSWLL